MLDAYTVRKIAPRLLFAVIGVNLSIYLCVAAIDITNVVGHGLGQLIRAPFDIGGNLDVSIDQGAGNAAGVPLLAAGVISGAAVVASDTAVSTVFALMLPVFVIIILAILTLVIRQALLVLLTLISPVAIVLSVLPGTERFFRQWLDLFFRTLIIYPMIAGLFAVSDVLASIAFANSNAGSNATGAVNVIAGIMFAFMPIALIPFTFRLSGGVLGAFSNATSNLRNMANRFAGQRLQQNLGKGFQNIQGGGLFRNVRTKEEDYRYWDKDAKEWKTGKRLVPVGKRAAMNKFASRATNLHKWNPSERWGAVTAASDRAIIRQAAAVKESEEAKALAGFDDENFVLANYGKKDWHKELINRASERFNYAEAGISPIESQERRRNLDNAISMMDAYTRVGGSSAARAAAAVELHGISTSYRAKYQLLNEDGSLAFDENKNPIEWDKNKHDESLKGKQLKTSHDQMQETIFRASGGARGLGNWIAAQSIGAAKQAGRYDMAASASAVLMYQEAMRSGDDYAVQKMKDYYDDMMVKRVTPAQATQGHPRAAEEEANSLRRKLEGVTSKLTSDTMKNASLEQMQADQEEYVRTLAHISGYHDLLGSAGKEGVSYFENLLGQKITTTNKAGRIIETTPAREIETYRTNEIFVRNTRQYGGIEGMEHDMTDAEKATAARAAIQEQEQNAGATTGQQGQQ